MWFRRDLRVQDNAALYHALKSCKQVYCAFVFDRGILDSLPRIDRRVEFIRESVLSLDGQLQELGASAGRPGACLLTAHHGAVDAVVRLAAELGVSAVFANHDDEPQSLARDAAVQATLEAEGKAFHSFKDHVIFERQELLTQAGKPYTVFTPYKNAWLKKVDDFYLKSYPVETYGAALATVSASRRPVPSLEELGFEASNLSVLKIPTGSEGGAQLFEDFIARMAQYQETRDYPAI
ncbi:MAG: deoxyribodipyrimidine photo-lyase, partial [Polaromonas sp.]|nr:deoxyribodipyrimidine photo-lyase [Polaromonas sp.]